MMMMKVMMITMMMMIVMNDDDDNNINDKLVQASKQCSFVNISCRDSELVLPATLAQDNATLCCCGETELATRNPILPPGRNTFQR